MIDVRELRFGNYYFYITGEIIKVDKKHFNYIDKFCKFANPIELTPEILEKWCGFEMQSTTSNYAININGYAMGISNNGYVDFDYLELEKISNVKYLHQLQNLIYALTGKELKVNYEKNI